MPRVYLRDERPRSASWSTTIALDAFRAVFGAHAPRQNQAARVALGPASPFVEALVWAGDAHWNGIYLPEAIVFVTESSPAYPDLWFYVARLGERLDVCSVRGGDGSTWEDAIDAGEPIPKDDAATRRALEAAFAEVVAGTVDPTASSAAPAPAPAPSAPASPRPRTARSQIARLARCAGWTDGGAQTLAAALPARRSGYGLVEAIAAHCRAADDGRVLVHVLDWNAGMDDVAWTLRRALRAHLGHDAVAALANGDETVAIYEDGELERMAAVLAELDLDLLYLDSPGDDCLLVVSRTAMRNDALRAATRAFGWRAHVIPPA